MSPVGCRVFGTDIRAEASDDRAPTGSAVATPGRGATPATQQLDKTAIARNRKTASEDKRERITPRLRHALDLMVWGDETGKPLDWNDACRKVNISARSMRKSLERHAVRRYLHQQKQVLRACLSAKSLSRLDEIAAQRANMNAAVNAIRAIDGEASEDAQMRHSEGPGVTITIIQAPAPTAPAPMVDVAPRPAPIMPPYDPQSQGGDE